MNKVFMLNTLNWAGDNHVTRPDLGCWTSREAAQGYIDNVFKDTPYAAQIVEIEINNPSSEHSDLLAKIDLLNERIEELKDENKSLRDNIDNESRCTDCDYSSNGMRRR